MFKFSFGQKKEKQYALAQPLPTIEKNTTRLNHTLVELS